jgi:hypothetical protein
MSTDSVLLGHVQQSEVEEIAIIYASFMLDMLHISEEHRGAESKLEMLMNEVNNKFIF